MKRSTADWSYDDAAHLLRRAAFGGTPEEIGRAVDAGREATVDALLSPAKIEASVDTSPRRWTFEGIIHWWIDRMLRTTRPLEERMTFFWHNHFATSIAVVRHPELMVRQNELFRAHALGNARELTAAVARDPAMLLWLDNDTSRKEHPNENFARELFELFTLGLGRYTESDVLAASRALTGSIVTARTSSARFAFDASIHDDGEKTILGRRGAWKGDDVVRLATDEPAHAAFLTRKLVTFFAGVEASGAEIERLARVYVRADGELRPLVREILLSPAMISPLHRWNRIKSPIDHAVMACRLLGIDADPAKLADVLSAQGLILFAPPDPNGWGDGLDWIHSSSLLMRMQFARAAAAAFEPVKVTAGRVFRGGAEMLSFYLRLLGPLEVETSVRERLAAFAIDASVQRQRGVVSLILSMPEWQRN